MLASQEYQQKTNASEGWETYSKVTGFLSFHLQLVKRRDFCHYFWKTIRFIETTPKAEYNHLQLDGVQRCSAAFQELLQPHSS